MGRVAYITAVYLSEPLQRAFVCSPAFEVKSMVKYFKESEEWENTKRALGEMIYC